MMFAGRKALLLKILKKILNLMYIYLVKYLQGFISSDTKYPASLKLDMYRNPNDGRISNNDLGCCWAVWLPFSMS